MPDQRHVYRVGNSTVVAVPKLVRKHMKLEAGAPVYWHTVRAGEAVLTRRPARTGGHPEGLALQRQLDAARSEIERLERRLAGRDQAVLHEGKSVGWAEASKYYAKIEGDIAAVHELVRSIDARLPFRRRRRSPRAEPPTRAVAVAGSVDAIPSPDPPSTSAVVDGGADTSGAEPPGVPL
jgi:antitoxin component of MazEF toxin-antitoxin module